MKHPDAPPLPAWIMKKDGRIVPFVTSVDVKCNINRFDINIKMHGNILTDLASLFEVFFVGTVAGLIEESIVLTLNTGAFLTDED